MPGIGAKLSQPPRKKHVGGGKVFFETEVLFCEQDLWGECEVIIYSEYGKFQVIFPCGETGRARRALRLNRSGTEGIVF